MRISYWSSDVCSSDLAVKEAYTITNNIGYAIYFDSSEYGRARISMNRNFWICPKIPISGQHVIQYGQNRSECQTMRSEERRVGKECVSQCRSGWSPSN